MISADKWNKAHLAAWVWAKDQIQQAEKKLKNNNIGFEIKDIPNYFQGRTAYRIFVFGRDVAKLTEFKKKYYKK